mgnify:CR=1 FL=1
MSFENSCRSGNLKTVKEYIKNEKQDLNYGIVLASINGHMDIVKLLVENGANNFKIGFILSFLAGNFEISDIMIENGANGTNYICKELISNEVMTIDCYNGKHTYVLSHKHNKKQFPEP